MKRLTLKSHVPTYSENCGQGSSIQIEKILVIWRYNQDSSKSTTHKIYVQFYKLKEGFGT